MTQYENQQLNEADKELIQKALHATETSYAPYSKFHVGAAVRMTDGQVFTGSNQENIAFPACVCAERVALLYAVTHSNAAPATLAVTATDRDGWVSEPVTPCGECRQVLLEMQRRFGTPVRILMAGKTATLVCENAEELLPGAFQSTQLAQS